MKDLLYNKKILRCQESRITCLFQETGGKANCLCSIINPREPLCFLNLTIFNAFSDSIAHTVKKIRTFL